MTDVVERDEEEPTTELIRQAELFEERLRAGSGADSTTGVDRSRIARILKLLNVTLAPGTTRSVSASGQRHAAIAIPPVVGRFEIGRFLGQGGFGAVFQALDTLLHREVAIKAVPRRVSSKKQTNGAALTPPDDDRLREARAAAKLNHPALVPLYEVFEDEQYLYLVSELCNGPTLAEYLRQTDRPVDPCWAVEITLRLAEAIAHAHGRGLVHRDIKPGNVLLAPERSESDLLPFTPRLTDFGLVLDTDQDPVDNQRPRLIGTILYLPPEQLLGRDGTDARMGDVYALGLLLYELLSGELPYRSSNPVKRLEEICKLPVPHVENRSFFISRDLHSIYRKALAKSPEDRYPSARAMADDLMRHRDGREVSSRRRSNAERIYRAISHAPFMAALLLAFVTLALSSATVYAWNNRLLREQSRQLHQAYREASASRREAVETAYLSDLNQAFWAVAKHDPAMAMLFAKKIREYADESELKRFDLRLLETIAGKGWFELEPLDSAVEEVVPLPNTARFAVVGGNQLRIYRPDAREPVREIVIDKNETIHALAVAPGNDLIAIGVSGTGFRMPWLSYGGSEVRFISLSGASVPNSISGFDATIDALDFDDDGKRIVVGARYEPPTVFRLEGSASSKAIAGTRRNEDLVLGPGDQLTSMPEHDQLRVGNVRNDETIARFLAGKAFSFRRLHCSQNGRWIAATLHDGSSGLLYDRDESSKPPITLSNPQGELCSIRLPPRGDFVVAGTVDGGVSVWRTPEKSLEPNESPIS